MLHFSVETWVIIAAAVAVLVTIAWAVGRIELAISGLKTELSSIEISLGAAPWVAAKREHDSHYWYEGKS